ncbi:hypothetical protein NOR53_2595 [gamma proteobacterium NOR5-3]|nr:hypothetical protein NOR53_2595 [gamma proteobacterium NOR5-3]
MLLVIFFRVLERHPKFLQSKLYFDDLEATFLKVYTELFPSSSHKVGESQAVQAFWKLGAGSPKLVLFNSPFGAELELESEMKKSAGHQVKSKPKLARLVEFAHFGLGDWELVQNPINTEAIVSFLLASHFSDIDTHSRLRSRIERALS